MSVATLCHIVGKLMQPANKARAAWTTCISVKSMGIFNRAPNNNSLQVRPLSSGNILMLFRPSSSECVRSKSQGSIILILHVSADSHVERATEGHFKRPSELQYLELQSSLWAVLSLLGQPLGTKTCYFQVLPWSSKKKNFSPNVTEVHLKHSFDGWAALVDLGQMERTPRLVWLSSCGYLLSFWPQTLSSGVGTVRLWQGCSLRCQPTAR